MLLSPSVAKSVIACASCLWLTASWSLQAAEPASDIASFRRDVQPVLKQMCLDCHGPNEQEADLRLDTLDPDLVNGADAETWHDVLNRLNRGEMPPEEAEPLSRSQHKVLVEWLTAQLHRAAEVRRSTGGQVVLRRLTSYEYNNTMRDLLGVDLDYARNLPPEPKSPEGFQNNGATLGISPLQLELYLQNARLGLGKAIVVGEQPQVFTHRADKSEKVRRVKGEVSNRLGRNDRFLVRMDEFPREGEILVRVTAGAMVADNVPFPRMRVTLGVRADTRAPEETLAEVDVTASADEPQTFEFRGYIEDFPLPGHNPKYPGLQITIYNGAFDDSNQKSKGKKQSKGENGSASAEPLIEIHSVEFEGPVLESWPPTSHTRIFLPSKNIDDEPQYAREVLQQFLTRAYRRPATRSDVDKLMKLYEQLRPGYATLEQTMREVLAMALISPEFLYLVEPRQDPGQKETLNDYELATRLSYFLWSSMPDERLFELAAANKLHDPQVLAGEVERMIEDPRSRQFVEHFTNQWFDLAAVDRVAVNPEYHPDFDDRLKGDMQAETRHFFATILYEDLSCLRLLDADFAMLNHRLASHYGIPGPRSTAFERVDLTPEDRRGGLLTQGSFLLANSNGEDSHPIKRAVWMLDRLLDSPPAPPPPDVPELDADQPDLAGLSLKQQLEAHREKDACNNCHRGIDPWGVVLENYDALGHWRTTVAGPVKDKRREKPPVDATATLPDGAHINGVEELKAYLLTQQRDQFAEAVVKRLLTYSLGRSLDLSDHPVVHELTEDFAQADYRLRDLMIAIVQSELFQTK